jgi:uncharacterized membrane protein
MPLSPLDPLPQAPDSMPVKLFKFFIQGLLVITPVGITMFAIYWLFTTVDGFLPNLIHSFFPELLPADQNGYVRRIPGWGFIVTLLLVTVIGWLSRFFLIGKVMQQVDKSIEKTPGVKFIYVSVKDLVQAFAGNKKKFDRPVLVNVDGDDVWRIGFITQTDAHHFKMPDHVVVYVPHSYAISGITYLVPRSKVRPAYNTSAADAMKFTVTGGVTHFKDDEAPAKPRRPKPSAPHESPAPPATEGQ